MAKIIIGIHGLGNKPPRKVLRKWWKKSLCDGLKRIGHNRLFFRFDMVYWADIMHEAPLDLNEKDKENEFYIEEPYVPPQTDNDKEPGEFRKKVLDFIEKQLDKIMLNDDLTVNYSFVTDLIIRHFFKELGCYFAMGNEDKQDSCPPVKDATDTRLKEILMKHKGKEILLISHSMGTIVAYDVLTQVGQEIPVDTFVTMGSPLGLPAIIGKLAAERTKITGTKFEARTPENVVSQWFNFSDLEDKIAFNYNLGDDYKENTHKVLARDMIVYNNYTIDGNRNPHKAYGYLRTPELAQVIDDFLNRGRSKPITKIMEWINKLFTQ
ncbi:alpha/beta hydrolase [Candidatus Omnitrophota bacterium]